MSLFSIDTKDVSDCPDWLAAMVVKKPEKAKKKAAKATTRSI